MPANELDVLQITPEMMMGAHEFAVRQRTKVATVVDKIRAKMENEREAFVINPATEQTLIAASTEMLFWHIFVKQTDHRMPAVRYRDLMAHIREVAGLPADPTFDGDALVHDIAAATHHACTCCLCAMKADVDG